MLPIWGGGHVRQRKLGPHRKPAQRLVPHLPPEKAHEVQKVRALLDYGAPALGDVPPLPLPDLRVGARVTCDNRGGGAADLSNGRVWRAFDIGQRML